MAQSRTWDVDRVSRNQPTTWPILVHWIKIERLWLNGEEDGAGDRAPDGASPEVHWRHHFRRREGVGELEQGVAELTRGLGSSMKLGRNGVDGGPAEGSNGIRQSQHWRLGGLSRSRGRSSLESCEDGRGVRVTGDTTAATNCSNMPLTREDDRR